MLQIEVLLSAIALAALAWLFLFAVAKIFKYQKMFKNFESNMRIVLKNLKRLEREMEDESKSNSDKLDTQAN